jgi:hypothetical protein
MANLISERLISQTTYRIKLRLKEITTGRHTGMIDIDLGTITTSDIKIVTGSLYETGGNEGKTSGWGFLADIIEGAAAHTNNYFGAISACDPSKP